MKHFYNLFSKKRKNNSRLRNLGIGLLMLTATNSFMKAQVSIGTGTTTGVVPVVMSTAYSYSQQIFNTTEINAGGSITGIKLYLGASSTIANSDDWTVYMATTDKTLFDSTTDWIPEASLTQVFSGTVVNNNGEVTITFPTAFVYNGLQNLVLVVDENKPGTNTTANRFYVTSTSSVYPNRSIYRSASSDISPSAPGTGTRTSVFSNITFLGISESCGLPSNITAVSTTTDSAVLTWDIPTTGTPSAYEYYYSTSDVPPANSAAAMGSVGTNSLNLNSVLTSGSYYYFYVRSVCGAQKSVWTLATVFLTACNPATSMYENFDTYGTGSSALFPPCWLRLDAQGTVNVSSTTPNSGTGNMYQYAASGNSNIVVLPFFSNISANTHWLRFRARVTAAPRDIQVGYITNVSDAATFVPLQTLSVTNTAYTDPLSEYTVEVPATVPATARLAIKNPGNSTTTLYYDDVYWEAKPACIKPFDVTSGIVGSGNAQISWSASSSPSNGYDIYYSTTNTAPTSSTTPNVVANPGTTATISPLSPSTPYYVWVRANCGSGSVSEWSSVVASFTTLCQPPAILSVMGATVCPGTSGTLSATADAGATITWYDASTGGNTLTTGSSYTTPNLSSTTNYYVSASVGSSESVGVANPSVLTNGGTTSAGTTFYMEATVANTPITVQSVDVFPSAAGSSSFIRVYLGTASTPVYEIPFTSNIASGGVTPQTIPLNIVLNPGVYRFKIEGSGSYYRNYSSPGGVGQSFPYGQGNFTLTGGSNVTTGYYLFYNFIVGNICESARTMVTATVDATCLSTSEAQSKNVIKVYPNPFSDVVNINRADLVKTIRVSDLSGKLLKTINQPESQIRLTELSQGMYILNLEMKDGSRQAIKVIKK